MKRYMMSVKRCLLGFLIVFAILVLLSPSESSGKTVLRAITALPKNDPTMDVFFMYVDAVNKKGKGELTIQYIGGPEAISSFEQASAVAKGVVDVTGTPASYAKDIAQGCDLALQLSPLTPWEERKAGFYDKIRSVFIKQNLYWLGRTVTGNAFYVYTKPAVAKYEDLLKLKIRCSKGTLPIIEGLGLVPVIMPTTEVYTAVERGVVDGLVTVPTSYSKGAFWEVTKYVINHPILRDEVGIMINLKTWNKLPKQMQALLQDTMIEIEPRMVDYYTKSDKDLMEKAFSSGVKPITFAPAEAAKYVSAGSSRVWTDLEKANKDLYLATKDILSRK